MLTLLAVPWLIAENRDQGRDGVQALGALAPAVGVDGVRSPLQGATAGTAPATTGSPLAVASAVDGGRAQEGKATFRSYDDVVVGPRACAHPTLPTGTALTVTNLNTGKSTTCVVRDRGAFPAGRVVELDLEVFTELAEPALGVIPVRLSW